MIKEGSKVEVHYVGKLTNGEIFDTSENRETLFFEVGKGQVIPGFEEAVLGRKEGDNVTINIMPEFAYGEVREDLFVKVPIDKMPGDVEVGQSLNAVSQDGNPIPVKVEEVNDDYVLINGNHPLSGKELIFDINIISISE